VHKNEDSTHIEVSTDESRKWKTKLWKIAQLDELNFNVEGADVSKITLFSAYEVTYVIQSFGSHLQRNTELYGRPPAGWECISPDNGNPGRSARNGRKTRRCTKYIS
jgi:hypothetical protein